MVRDPLRLPLRLNPPSTSWTKQAGELTLPVMLSRPANTRRGGDGRRMSPLPCRSRSVPSPDPTPVRGQASGRCCRGGSCHRAVVRVDVGHRLVAVIDALQEVGHVVARLAAFVNGAQGLQLVSLSAAVRSSIGLPVMRSRLTKIAPHRR